MRGEGWGLMRVWPLYSVCAHARRCPQFWLCSFVFFFLYEIGMLVSWLCFKVSLSPLLVILSFILLVLLVLLLLFLLLGLVLLAEADELAFVIHGAGVVADGDDGWRPGDDEGFGRDLSGLQGLGGVVGLCGAVSEVPAVAVDTGAHRRRQFSTSFSIYVGRRKQKTRQQ